MNDSSVIVDGSKRAIAVFPNASSIQVNQQMSVLVIRAISRHASSHGDRCRLLLADAQVIGEDQGR